MSVKSRELTVEQAKAVGTLDRDLVVTAGPGAGKTRVLTERVMRILDHGAAELSQIAAITFTRKAASEMKLRIRQEIERRIETAATSHARQARERWIEIKQQLPSSAISTIHGLCSRILHAHPVEAKLDPFYAVLDEFEAAMLLRETAEEFVLELVEAGDATGSRYIAARGRNWLVETLVSVFERLRAAGLSPRTMLGRTKAHLGSAEDSRVFLDGLLRDVESLAGNDQLTQKQQESLDQAIGPARALIEELARGLSIDVLHGLEARAARVKGLMPDARGKMKDAIHAIKVAFEDLPAIVAGVLAGESAEWFATTLEEFGRRVDERKSIHGTTDFSDLEILTRDLLKSNSEVRTRASRLYRFVLVDEFQDTNSLQKEILDLLCPSGGRSNLFVVGDGKQSIYRFRGAEVEVFERARADVQTRGGEHVALARNFRSHAELVRLFNRLFGHCMRFADEPRLSKLFPAVRDADPVTLGFVAHESGEADRAFAAERPAIEVLAGAMPEKSGSQDRRDIEAGALARRLRRMLDDGERIVYDRVEGGEVARAVRGGDIAILLRALSDLKIYERALRQAGIPYVVVAGRGFYHRQEILDLISLLEFLHNTTDDLALAAVLRSPFFAMDDDLLLKLRLGNNTQPIRRERDETLYQSLGRAAKITSLSPYEQQIAAEAREALSELLSIRSHATVEELLDHGMERTDFLAVGATLFDHRQRTSNIEKFIDHAAAFAHVRGEGLDGFLRHIRSAIDEEAREGEAETEPEDEHSVRVMTVHKSKGLEFPVVVLPDLARSLTANSSELRFDRDLGFGIEVADSKGNLHGTILGERIGQLARLREEFESMRLFYVAATRAEDYLLFSFAENTDDAGSLKPKAGTWAAALVEAFDLASEPGGIRTIERGGVKIMFERYSKSEPLFYARKGRPLAHAIPEISNGAALTGSAARDRLTDEDQRALNEIEETLKEREWPVPFSHGPLSVTRFMEFANCPRQAWYRRWLGRTDRAGDPAATAWDEKSASFMLSAAERGGIVHRFCELYRDGIETQPLLARIFAERQIPPEQQEAVAREIEPMFERYKASAVFKEIGSAARVESEYAFWLRTSHCLVRGVIDKIVVAPDGRAKIIDFKTNRIDAAEARTIPPPYATQLALYSLAARDALSLPLLSAALYFLEPDVLVSMEFTDEDLSAARVEIDEIAKKLIHHRDAESFPARPEAKKCAQCDFRGICPEGSPPRDTSRT